MKWIMWVVDTLGTSVGKKLMMAVTGLCFIGFITSHLVGNMTIYGGFNSFNNYAEKLHSLGSLISLAEWILLALALVHVTTGVFLFFQNIAARPDRYEKNKRAGGRTISSSTMPYTGLIILIFVVFHLIDFHFVDKTNITIFEIVLNTFQNPVYALGYIMAMVVLAVHIRHGFWSAFQTLGANHPKYMPLVMGASILFSIIVGIGFGFIPIYLSPS
jgi:succinate dehydrogenase / fumarate reductase cytochrome b subunit